MSGKSKIVFLGGGSRYFMNRMTAILMSERFAGSELVIYDIDAKKVELVAETYRRLNEQAGKGFEIRSTVDLADAVDGATFAISSIGGSGAEVTPNVRNSYYHTADLKISEKYGVYQVIGDTCGPAGMMMGLRSVPAYIEICREFEKRSPEAVLLNHSNPMATLVRAMRKHTKINAIGICHGVQGGIKHVAELLDVSPHELDIVWVGTNHYYWVTRLYHKGRDVYREALQRLVESEEEGDQLSAHLAKVYDHIILYPHDSHLIEFYPYGAQAGSLDGLPYSLPADARRRQENAEASLSLKGKPTDDVRKMFFEKYTKMLDEAKLPDAGVHEDQLFGERVVPMMEAIADGRRELFIVNVPNNYAIPNLPPEAIVEIEAISDSRGVRGLRMGECPRHLKGILEKRFVWHDLVVDAAVSGDRRLALEAMLLDEMAIPPDRAEALLDELLEASKDLLPRFFG